jgi:hypothetical protein
MSEGENETLENAARQRFETLTEAETQLLRVLRSGEIADCRLKTRKASAVERDNASLFTGERTIRAKLIRWICVSSLEGSNEGIRGIRVGEARIIGSLDLSFLTVHYPIEFSRCWFDGAIKLTGAELKMLSMEGTRTNGLFADGVTVSGGVLLSSGFEAAGPVNLCGARIGGNLECDDASFKIPGDIPLDASGAKVGGDVRMRNGFRAVGPVIFRNAEIGGNLDCHFAAFNNHVDTALDAEGASIGGDVSLNGDFCSEGEIRFLGARIGGRVWCDKGKFKNLHGTAINANSASVRGSIYFGSGFQADGRVELVNAEVTVSLSCAGGKFTAEQGPTLNLDGLRTGDLFLTNGFEAKGEVRLVGAKIGGQLVCSGGIFRNATRRALNVADATVGSSVLLNNRFKAEGEISLATARIGGDVRLTRANLASESGTTFDAEGLKVSHGLYLDELTHGGNTKIRLCEASSRALYDDENSWPVAGNLALDGFTYDSLGGKSPVDAKTRLKWLRRQLPKEPRNDAFHPQTYRQLAKVLRSTGHEKEARQILIEYERDRDRFQQFAVFTRLGRWVYQIFGYGYRPHFGALIFAAAIFLLGWALVSLAHTSGLMVPTEKGASIRSSHLSPFLYSLDAFLPVHAFHQEESWWPAVESWDWCFCPPGRWPRGYLLQLWLCFQILAGWILTGLVVAGFAGIVRRE